MAGSDQADLAIALRVINATKAELDSVKASLGQLDQTVKKIQPDFDQAAASADKFAKTTAKSAAEATSSMKSFADQLKQGIAMGAGFSVVGIAAGAVAGAIGAAKDSVIGFNAQLQQSKAAFSALLGSSQAADKFVKELQTLAATTPFEFPAVLKGAQRFVGMGMAASEVIPLLKDISTIVSAMGGTSEQVDRVTLALSQMSAKGKVSQEELNQLSEAGVQGAKILADAMGLPIGEVIKLAQTGQISADTFIAAFQKAARTPAMLQAADNMSKSWNAATSNMADGVRKFLSTAGAPLFEALSDGVNKLGDWLTKSKEAENAATALGNVVGWVVDKWKFWLNIIGLVTGKIGDLLNMIPGVSALRENIGAIANTNAEVIDPEAVARVEAAKAEAAALRAQLDEMPKKAKEITDALAANAAEMRQNEVATRANQVAMRALKQEIDDIKTAFEAQRAPLETNLRILDDRLRDIKTRISDTKDAYAELKEPIQQALKATEAQLRANKQASDDVKDSYEAQAKPLRDQIDLLTKANDVQRQTFDLQERIKGNQISQALIDSEGDPVKRTALTLLLARNQLDQRGLELQKGQLDLSKQLKDLEQQRKDGKISRQEYDLEKAILQSKQEQNKLDRASFDLIDQGAQAQAKAEQYALQRSAAGRKLVDDTKDAGNALLALPLQQQLKDLTTGEEARLKVLETQRKELETQAQSQKDMIDGLDAALQAVLKPLETEAKRLQAQHDEIEQALREINQMEKDRLQPLVNQEGVLTRQAAQLADQKAKLDDIKAKLTDEKEAQEKILTVLQQQYIEAKKRADLPTTKAPTSGVGGSVASRAPLSGNAGGDYRSYARAVASAYGVNPDILERLLQQESGFNPNAINEESGASGIAQFMPDTAREVAKKMGISILDFWQSVEAQIEGAALYYKQQLDTFGSDELAAAAYNAGPGTVGRYLTGAIKELPKETQDYIRIVVQGLPILRQYIQNNKDLAATARALGVDLSGTVTDMRNLVSPMQDASQATLGAAYSAVILGNAASASANGLQNQKSAIEDARDALYEYQKAQQKAGVKLNLDISERIAVATGTGGAPSFDYSQYAPSQYGGGPLPGFANGGVVPGPLGAPLLAMVHGGETVIPAGKGGAGIHVVVNIGDHASGDARALARKIAPAIRDELISMQRSGLRLSP